MKPSSAIGFDPLGDREERGELAGFAIDGKDSTDWHSESYDSADFGRLKTGVGLLLDMGESVPVKQVTVDFGGTSGGTAELRVGDSPQLESLSVLQKVNGVSGKKTFTAEAPKKGRYVLVWFTKMPTYQGKFRGQVQEIKVFATK